MMITQDTNKARQTISRYVSIVTTKKQNVRGREYYPSNESVNKVLRRFIDMTDISMNRLSILLNCQGKYVWRWVNGYNRPSASYLLRMLDLANQSLDGEDIAKYSDVDWEKGEIRAFDAKSGKYPIVALLPPDKGMARGQASPFDRVERVLPRFLDLCDVHRTRMDRLLGAPANYVWRWVDGAMNPSTLYFLRMIEIANEALEGYDVSKYWSIDWETGLIHMSREVKNENRDIPIVEGTDIPKSEYRVRPSTSRVPDAKKQD